MLPPPGALGSILGWGTKTPQTLKLCAVKKKKKKKKNGVTGKFGLGVQNDAGQLLNRVLPREYIGHSKHPLPTTQKILHMDITRWSILKSD